MEKIGSKVFERLAEKEVDRQSTSVMTREHVCRVTDVSESYFIGVSGIDDRLVGKVNLTDDEKKHWIERLHKTPKLKKVVFNRRDAGLHPYIVLCTGKVIQLFSHNRYLVAGLFSDYLAEFLCEHWDQGFFRYAWARRAEEHQSFNCSLAIRDRNRGTWIEKVALCVGRAILRKFGKACWDSPELKELINKVKSGQAQIVCALRAGRPKGSKNRSLKDTRLNSLEKRVAELERKLEFEEEINIKQTNNIQTLLEKLNECINTVNGLVLVHKSWVDEDGMLHAEHRSSKALSKTDLKAANAAFDDTCRNPDGTPFESNTTEPTEQQEVKPEPTRERASTPAKKGPLFV